MTHAQQDKVIRNHGFRVSAILSEHSPPTAPNVLREAHESHWARRATLQSLWSFAATGQCSSFGVMYHLATLKRRFSHVAKVAELRLTQSSEHFSELSGTEALEL